MSGVRLVGCEASNVVEPGSHSRYAPFAGGRVTFIQLCLIEIHISALMQVRVCNLPNEVDMVGSLLRW